MTRGDTPHLLANKEEILFDLCLHMKVDEIKYDNKA
jgi:hypothetical protein